MRKAKRAAILTVIDTIAILAFSLASVSFAARIASGPVIIEGWLVAFYGYYVDRRFRVYCNRRDRIRCGCYETEL